VARDAIGTVLTVGRVHRGAARGSFVLAACFVAALGPAAGVASRADNSTADIQITDAVVSAHVIREPYRHVLTVKNAGPAPSGDVIVYESVTTRTEFVSATATSGGCDYVATYRTVVCILPSLMAGDSVRIEITIRGVELGGYSVTATASGAAPDPNLANNYASSSVGIVAKPVDVALGQPDRPGVGAARRTGGGGSGDGVGEGVVGLCSHAGASLSPL